MKNNDSKKCQCPPVEIVSRFEGSPPQDSLTLQGLTSALKGAIKGQMPKRKCKFGKGATRGGDQKSC